MSKKYLLDPFNLPIYSQTLIESSAGTGKTYVLIILYIRILLGLKAPNELYKYCFSVKKILLITFNKKLSENLKKKIIKLIIKLKNACLSNKKNNNKIIIKFLKKIKNRFKAFLLLDTAEKQFKKASIFNINAFCKNILYKYQSFEYIFKYKLLNKEDYFLNKIIKDYWNKTIENIQDNNLTKIILNIWPTAQCFIKYFKPLLKNIYFKKKKKYEISIEKILKINIKIIKKIKSIINLLNFEMFFFTINFLKLNNNKFNYKNIKKLFSIIYIWSKSSNTNVPKEIEIFSLDYLNKYRKKNIIKKNMIKNKNFLYIGFLLKKIIDIKNFLIKKTILELEKNIIFEKKKYFLFTYNDVFELIKKLFLSNKLLLNKITNNYSIVLIDELQDLNINLVNIFYYLYILNKKKIILFCDNKQSIYNFLDNSLYLTIKKYITNIFYMKINWRFSSKLNYNINWLFSNVKNAFLLKNINYLKNYISKSNNNISFNINNIEQKAFTFWYYTDKNNKKGITSNVYKNVMAKQCAYQIKKWLFLISKNKTQLCYKKKKKYLSIQDIVIIVKNKIEADLIKKELDFLDINSFYASYKQNIFKSLEAYELLNLLKFIYYNNNNCTQFYKYIDRNNLLYINIKLLHKNHKTLLELINFYKNIWNKYGLLCMLNTFCKKEQIIYNLLHQKNIKQILYKILYLGEILQYESLNNPEPAYILRWLENKINKNFYEQTNQNILLKPKNVITILSIYKSKGLEFPIVCLPFISNFKINTSKCYFNNTKKSFLLNLENKNKKINEINRLSKDLRLLYVALTRAIFHCSIGISPIVKSRKLKFTDLHKNSLGYLLQKKKIFSVENTNLLIKKISKTKNKTISIVWLKNNILYNKKNFYSENFYKKFLLDINTNIVNKEKNKKIYFCNKKNINSFTGLIKKCNYINKYNLFFIDQSILPKGLNIGKFVHKILEQIKFVSKINKIWLKEQLIINGYYNKLLFNYLYNWLKKIFIYPFNINGLNLSNISCKKQLRELKFFMSIKKEIKIQKINSLFKKYINKQIILKDNLIIKDVFTGIIDMLFFWKGKYYILDFKNNYLGKKKNNYKINYLENVILEKYYWIQYYFYTLAIHRFLIKRDYKYNYKKHFGGVYYFFIQSVNYINKYNFDKFINKYGIFYDYPNYQLIKKLNDLF